mgnify:CR=1 FL=1
MKKFIYVLFMIIIISTITGCTDEIDGEYNNVDLDPFTYQFNGKSESFAFDIGKVNFTDTEKGILIKGFKQTKKIKNLSKIKFSIYFNNELWSSQETKPNQQLNKVNSIFKNIIFYERGIICTQDSGVNCEQTKFDNSTENNFKDITKIEVEYCTTEDKCNIEQFNLNYK